MPKKRSDLRQVLGFIRFVASEYGVQVDVSRSKAKGQRAECSVFQKGTPITLFVKNAPEPHDLIKSFFHELAHVHCVRNHIYPSFHGRRGWTKFMKAGVLHGLQAERYVDQLGKKLMAQWVPIGAIGRWEKAYNNHDAVMQFKFYQALPWYMALTRKGIFGRKAA